VTTEIWFEAAGCAHECAPVMGCFGASCGVVVVCPRPIDGVFLGNVEKCGAENGLAGSGEMPIDAILHICKDEGDFLDGECVYEHQQCSPGLRYL